MSITNKPGTTKGFIAPWRLWTAPALIGIPIAVTAGLYVSIPTLLEQGYFHFHLYRTGFSLLAGVMNRWALVSVGLLLLLLLAFLAGNSTPARWRRVLRIALPLAALAAVFTVALLRVPAVLITARTMLRAFPGLALHVITRPATLVSLLVILLLVELIIFRARRRKATAPATAQRLRKIRGILATAAVLFAALFIVAFLGVNLAAWALTIQARRALADRPNIIFIMADTLRADHVGCYGYDLQTTPNIDRLAGDGIRFQSAVSQASYTVWSVGSVMSSRYPDTLFPIWGDQVNSLLLVKYRPFMFAPMLSEVLHDRGYTTHAIVSNPLLLKHPGNIQGYDSYADDANYLPYTQPTAPVVTRTAIERLRQIKGRKFFLSLVYMDPHAPYLSHPGYQYGDSARDAERNRIAAQSSPRLQAYRRQYLRRYDSEIGFTDHAIGEFLDALKREGLYDDSLIVFFADHGEEFLEHGRFGHTFTLYDEVLQVPLIVKLPRQHRATVVKGTFPLIDLYPSVLQYLGIDRSALRLHGEAVGISSLLRCADKPLYSATVQGMQAVRNGRYTYIRKLDVERMKLDMRAGKTAVPRVVKSEAYDLARDPLEQTNLLPAAPAGAAALPALLQSHEAHLFSTDMQSLSRSWSPGIEDGPSPELLDRLKTLGYLNPGASR